MKNEYINSLRDGNMRALVQSALMEFSNDEKIADAEGIISELLFLLKHEKIIQDGVPTPMFVDILIAAGYLHNICYDQRTDVWKNIFDAREILKEFAEKNNFETVTLDALFQAIESQLGRKVPVPLLYPPMNSPGAHFALACALHYDR